jgi:hypothetical protein
MTIFLADSLSLEWPATVAKASELCGYACFKPAQGDTLLGLQHWPNRSGDDYASSIVLSGFILRL